MSNAILAEVERTYLLLETNFQKIHAACTTTAQRKRFVQEYVSARDAYWKAVGEALEDKNAKVKQLTAALKVANADIKSDLKSLKDTAAFLNLVGSAVSLAASVVTLAAA